MNEAVKSGLELMQRGIELILMNLEPDEAREPPDQLLNTRQLREFAGMSSATVNKIIHQMEKEGVGVYRHDRSVRISRNQFLKFIEGSKNT